MINGSENSQNLWQRTKILVNGIWIKHNELL